MPFTISRGCLPVLAADAVPAGVSLSAADTPTFEPIRAASAMETIHKLFMLRSPSFVIVHCPAKITDSRQIAHRASSANHACGSSVLDQLSLEDINSSLARPRLNMRGKFGIDSDNLAAI